jgi:acyl-lipid omega-6 desaturase (Delta-12 desaturase)
VKTYAEGPTPAGAAVGMAPTAADVNWRKVVEPYVGPDDRSAAFQAVVTLGLLAFGMWAIAAVLDRSVWLALALAAPTAGLLVKTFILMHDCGAHGSFFTSRKLTEFFGFITGAITLTPFDQWRRDHALHHASSGDLDRRGHGDVPTWTVKEYLAKTPKQRFWYRVIRHPAALLFGGPFHLVIGQRFRSRSKATKTKQINSVLWTNVAIAVGLGVGIYLFGARNVLFAYGIPMYFAAMAGVWLFYVQHQFEDAYWEQHGDWDYLTASLKGSSHLKLPALFRWFTGNIGVHHVHHLAPKIPNYRLQRCHDENPLFQAAPVVTPATGMAALRLALWDEEQRRLIRFDELKVR